MWDGGVGCDALLVRLLLFLLACLEGEADRDIPLAGVCGTVLAIVWSLVLRT